MANYFVIDNTFRPYSFDELMKPYQMYAQEYDKQEALINEARDKEFAAENLDAVADEEAYKLYNTATNNLRAVSDELATRGLTTGLRSRLQSTAKDYKTTMSALQDAQTKLYAEQVRRANLGEDYVYQQDEVRIGDFLNGKSPNQHHAKLSDVTSDIAFEFQNRAKGITKDTWNKVLGQNGNVIKGYFDVTTETGLQDAQLDTILSLANPEQWNRYVQSNPTITEDQKNQLRGFVDAIKTEMDAVDYDKFNQTGKEAIWKAVVKGAHAGLGSEEHKYQVDRAYNPELAYRMQRDKIADAEKKEQKEIATGKKPFYTDPDGNNWYSDGALVWKHDKEGNEIMPPTPRSKVLAEEETETAEEKAARLAHDKAIEGSREAFPMYYSSWNLDRNSLKPLATSSGERRFNLGDQTEISPEALSPGKKQIIMDRVLNKYGLTFNDIQIWEDFDSGNANEYKITLRGTQIGTISEDSQGTPVVKVEEEAAKKAAADSTAALPASRVPGLG